jgi:lipoprotein signal peptidase
VNCAAGRAPLVLFVTAALAYAADRVSKLWAVRALLGHPIDLIPGAVTLRYVTNSGGAFSLGQGAPWLFAGVTVVVAGLIVAVSFRPRGTLNAVALGLVLGGALGNLTDRILHGPGVTGRVVDFLDFHVWPIFNLADASIVIGALLLAWTALRAESSDRRSEPGDASSSGSRATDSSDDG